MTKFNLVIFHTPKHQLLSDFTTIRGILSRKAPDIAVHVISSEVPVPKGFWREAAALPTLLFSPMPFDLDPRVRGARVFVKTIGKFEEARMLAEAGFPVPLTQKILRGTTLDERIWGPFTVIKPNMSYRGQGISLVRTRDVRWIDTKSLPISNPRHGQNLIAQQFIDTGPHTASYRVMTVLGQPIYAIKSTAVGSTAPLAMLNEGPIEIEVAANNTARRLVVVNEADIIDLARRIHSKLTHTPVMGIDIVRDHASGKPVVLELNSGGWTWHLSSEHGRKYQESDGLDLYGQFNALEVIAEALAKVTRRKAV
jgi:predicted ATP-grasp superfamily ATP-dependent carboligase